jgi:glycine cleavage system aminomethyltransferase T
MALQCVRCSFELTATECAAARTGAAFFDQSYFGKLQLDGPEADAAMQWMCGADLEGRAAGVHQRTDRTRTPPK